MPKAPPLRLGVNVDHVATLRNARAGHRPDPVRAALAAIEAGADGITAHLREDRRHIRDDDMARLKAGISKPLNFEMAATDDMLGIALKTAPHAVCLVPERRAELTTEGGLDVAGRHNVLQPYIARLNDAGIRIEQPKSVPCASGTMPVATATAEPPDEPEGLSAGFHGLRVTPNTSLKVLSPAANSRVLVLPSTMAPAAFRRRTTSASSPGT